MQRFIYDTAAESFDQLGGKLASLCDEFSSSEEKVKVVVAFSDLDPGRGNAILWLTKYFGVLPIELGGPTGELDVPNLTGFCRQSHLTLLIQSIPIVEERTHPIDTNPGQIVSTNKPSLMVNLRYHVPCIKGLKSLHVKASLDTLIHQVGAISQELTNNSSLLTGPVIYLAGIGLLEYPACAENLPTSKFIPWYLLSIDGMSTKRIYRQPELSQYLGKLRVGDLRITDLDSMIANMEGDPNYE